MSDNKYRIDEDDEGEYDAEDYPAQIIDVKQDYVRVLCTDSEDAEHIAKLLEANPFPE